jgi:CheY-like chemotaxis protein
MEFCVTVSVDLKPLSDHSLMPYGSVQTVQPASGTLLSNAMRTIAIIEDTDDNRDLLYYLLRDEFRVSRYKSGEEALRAFNHGAPDLIVMDIKLPGLDGIEVLNHMKQDSELCGIPTMAFTANAMSGDREKYLAAGFTAYASKPIVDIDDFIATIRGLLSSTHK